MTEPGAAHDASLAAPDLQYARAAAMVERLRERWTQASGTTIRCIETHISWVLLTGTHAYKFKKPVRLGFLDFGTLAARHAACNEELRVNRRLAPSIYLDVVAVHGTPEAPTLGGSGPVLDYAVRMREFAADAGFDTRLAQGRLSAAEVEALARRIAVFHAQAPVAGPHEAWGAPDTIVGTMRKTLERLAATGASCDDLVQWAEHEAVHLQAHWQARQREGRIREGHGDLHLANAVVLDDGPTAFDAIEFDPALRWIDVLDDAAFAIMDLLARGRDDLAWRFLDAYLEVSGDHAGLPVLRHYLVYRAAVRALVGRLQAGQGAQAARQGPTPDDYLACARRCIALGTPASLTLMRGLSGSGKSTVALALLQTAGAVRVRSDVERKRLFGLAALDDSQAQVAGGIYGPDATARTYARLAELTRAVLNAGYRVIVDAAFLRRDERLAMRALARAQCVPYTLIECTADAATLHARVRARQARRDDPSEADEHVLERQREYDQPLDDTERADAMVVDAAQPFDAAALAAAWLARSTGAAGH